MLCLGDRLRWGGTAGVSGNELTMWCLGVRDSYILSNVVWHAQAKSHVRAAVSWAAWRCGVSGVELVLDGSIGIG